MKYLIAYIAGVVTFLLALAVCNRVGSGLYGNRPIDGDPGDDIPDWIKAEEIL